MRILLGSLYRLQKNSPNKDNDYLAAYINLRRAVSFSDGKVMVDLSRMYAEGDFQQLVSYLQNYEAARSFLNQATSLNKPLTRDGLA